MSCWLLNKYSRLQDSRNMPMSIERGQTNRLVLQYDETLKLLYIYNNGHQLEMFCIHPLVFPHEYILKDVRILFNLKSQVDGSSSMKFRVRFQNAEAVTNFSAAVGKYVEVKPFEEWCRRNSDSNLLNDTALNSTLTNSSFCVGSQAGHSSAFMNVSVASTNVLPNDSQDSAMSSHLQLFKSSLTRSRSVGDVPTLPVEQPSEDHYPACIDASAQTEDFAPVGVQQPPVNVSVHIDNLLSVEAVREFGQILREVTAKDGENNVQAPKKKALSAVSGAGRKRGRPAKKPKDNEQPKEQEKQQKTAQNSVQRPSRASPARKRQSLADWAAETQYKASRSLLEIRRSKSRTIGGYRLRGNQD